MAQFNHNNNSSYFKISKNYRLRICNQYKKNKSIDTLAKEYNYSINQIQCIVDEKRKSRSVEHSHFGLVNLLDTVVYEWFQRAQKIIETGPITDLMLLRKAQECVQIFGLSSWIPDYEWVGHFRKKYNITNLDMTMLRIENESRPLSADINEVVMFVLKNNPVEYISNSIPEMKNDRTATELVYNYNKNNTKEHDLIIHDDIAKTVNCDIGELPAITNGEEAKKFLKPLEDYVLMKENFRAIGLIAQLEKIFEEETTNCNDISH